MRTFFFTCLTIPALVSVGSCVGPAVERGKYSGEQILSEESKGPVLQGTVTIYWKRRGRSINQKVLGVCLMHPPFQGEEDTVQSIFRGTSVRVWAREKQDWWDQLAPGLRALEPCHTLGFVDKSWHPEKSTYRSAVDNNLFAWQQPEAVVERVRFAFAQLKRLGIELAGPLYWEVWNEPQFAQNGAWNPEDLARYANDCARALKKSGLPVITGAPLHMGDDGWNRRLCAALDPEVIRFLVNHYYNVGWHKLKRPASEFLRRAGYGPVLRERVRRDRALVKEFGHGRWTLHCSEWNVHPPTYHPPFYASRDMAAALYAFSAVRVYLEEGLGSAQFFLLSCAGENGGHFAALNSKEGRTPVLRPPGAALGLLRQGLLGERLKTDLKSPGYVRDGQLESLPEVVVPYLEAMVCRGLDGAIHFLLSNKHPEAALEVRVQGLDLPETLRATILTGTGENGEETHLAREVIRLHHNRLRLPPASITAIEWGP